MTETETIDALAEYWEEEIYINSDKPHYKKIRDSLKKENKEKEIEIDSDDDKPFYNPWLEKSE